MWLNPGAAGRERFRYESASTQFSSRNLWMIITLLLHKFIKLDPLSDDLHFIIKFWSDKAWMGDFDLPLSGHKIQIIQLIINEMKSITKSWQRLLVGYKIFIYHFDSFILQTGSFFSNSYKTGQRK